VSVLSAAEVAERWAVSGADPAGGAGVSDYSLDDTIGGRVWPGREWMTIEELLRAFEAVMRVEPRLQVHLHMYGGDRGQQNWAAQGRISVDGYMSAEEFDRLRVTLAEHGMYPYIGSHGGDEGDVNIAIGSKTWNGITTSWETQSAERSAVSNVGTTPPEAGPNVGSRSE
jgi:hypothetical protein